MVETRTHRDTVQLRANTDAAPHLAGYALKFERYSQNLGGFVEQVARGAVDKSIADGADVLCRWNHDDAGLLGRTGSGTLALTVDDTGLAYDVALPDTTVGRDVAALAARGDVTHSSFAFRTLEDEWGVTEQGFPLRTLNQVALVDVAPVNSPAYLDTSVGVRSLAAALNVDPGDVPGLDTGEIVRCLTTPTVIDVAPRRERLTAARAALLTRRPH